MALSAHSSWNSASFFDMTHYQDNLVMVTSCQSSPHPYHVFDIKRFDIMSLRSKVPFYFDMVCGRLQLSLELLDVKAKELHSS